MQTLFSKLKTKKSNRNVVLFLPKRTIKNKIYFDLRLDINLCLSKNLFDSLTD